MKKLSQLIFLTAGSMLLVGCVEDNMGYYDSSDMNSGYYSSSDRSAYNPDSQHFRGNGSGYYSSSDLHRQPAPPAPPSAGGYHDSSSVPAPAPQPVPNGGYHDSSSAPVAAPAGAMQSVAPANTSGYSSSSDNATPAKPAAVAKPSSDESDDIKQKPDEAITPVTAAPAQAPAPITPPPMPSSAPGSDAGGYSSSN